ncbi:hypothetical protein PNEG_00699 [Pneumocystis murina B123]|uniref:NADH dehydrogenase [ubiquinone] 1 alpha subcomplex subunit n=1 Tax=Pneumocystis murina (strain B123) TaxID=1069680 RepID=M7NVD7_PNEMU|nr:hypothetical protein PNEG_00699 [Pneumocystis murina B123]EMR11101.1 hypothetical protein PNEG_00699 [Pneumocystis murina B123]
MQTIGDTKYGHLVGTDSYGNKYYENLEEAPNRTRWVDYKSSSFDASQVEPGWNAWLRYMVDVPPSKIDTGGNSMKKLDPSWKKPFQPNLTFSRGAYKPYNTVLPKFTEWTPNVKKRIS